MNLFENLQLMKFVDEDDNDRYSLNEMAKLTPKRANKEICGDMPIYIYFSPCLDSHAPRVKFYGGSKETESTRDAPSFTFNINGAERVELQKWMTKKVCPNAYDDNILEKVKDFINRTLPVLLLVWFKKLDEDDALAYFQGHDSFKEMLNCINELDEQTKNELINSENLIDLHDKCKRYSLYTF